MTDALVVDLAALPHLDMLVSDEAQRRYAELRPALLAVSPTGFLGFLHYDDALPPLATSVYDPWRRFVPRRKGPRALSFGQGVHTCLGAALARLEVAEAMVSVAARLRGWGVEVEPHQVEWFPLSEPFRGVARLPVLLH